MQNPQPRTLTNRPAGGLCSPLRHAAVGLLAVAAACLAMAPARAVTIDWVTVGDPGNTADTTGDPNPAGAVADSFRIMKFEFTNQQYTDFLNSVAATEAGLTRTSQRDSNARGAGRHHGVASLGVYPAR